MAKMMVVRMVATMVVEKTGQMMAVVRVDWMETSAFERRIVSILSWVGLMAGLRAHWLVMS